MHVEGAIDVRALTLSGLVRAYDEAVDEIAKFSFCDSSKKACDE
jgi:hypothetical protein